MGVFPIFRSSCFFSLLCAACGGGGRDVIPESHDVQGVALDAGGHDQGGYEHIARRTLAVVGLAEGRGMDAVTAAQATDRLADTLEVCVEDLSSRGRLVDGAARIAAQIAPDGTPGGLSIRMAPGDAVKANAILCFIAPFKLTSFPVAGPEAPPRGIAIEATWGPHVQGVVGLGTDAGME
jgi:hypothetical protein